jgi:tetratricopeptide (TPR) repeat protein
MEPISAIALGYKAIEKLSDKLFEHTVSIFQGGPCGQAIVETAESIAGPNNDAKQKLGKILYDFCISEPFREMLDEAKRTQKPLTIEDFLTCLHQANVELPNEQTVITSLVRNLTVHLAAEDKVFAARLATERHEELLFQFQNQPPSVPTNKYELTEADETNIELRGELNAYKKLIDTEKVKAALQGLESARKSELNKSYSEKSLARIANLLGVCAPRLDDMATAEIEFDKACCLDPEDSNAFANKASTLVVTDRAEQAISFIEKARRLAPDDLSVASTYITVLSANSRSEDIDQLVNQNQGLLENFSCLLALGQHALSRADYDCANTLLKQGCEVAPQNARLRFMLARSLFIPMQQNLIANPPIDGVLTTDQEKVLKNVAELMSESLELMKNYDYDLNRTVAYMNRAGVRAISGDVTGALADLEDALRMEPDEPNAMANKARLLMVTGDNESALQCLESIPEKYVAKTRKLYSEVLYQLKRFDDALINLRAVWNADDRDHDAMDLHLADRLVELEHKFNGSEAAQLIVDDCLTRYQNSPESMRIAAQELARQGKFDKSAQVLIDAREKASPIFREWLTIDLARVYRNSGEKILSANEEYKSICDQKTAEFLWIEYINYLWEQGARFAAYYRAKSLRLSLGHPVSGITDNIEFEYLLRRGLTSEARDLLLSIKVGLTTTALCNLASLHFHHGDFSLARDVLDSIDKEKLSQGEFEFIQRLADKITDGLTQT